jgi:SAM-dependent methyltransferase
MASFERKPLTPVSTRPDNNVVTDSRHAVLCQIPGYYNAKLANIEMHLKNLQAAWEGYAQEDPMWAILTDPERKGNKWRPEEFFASGQADVDQMMAYLESLNIKIAADTALDFGCGIGRLSQGLCRIFSRVHGVDIAPSMIEGARRYNQYAERCTYHLNQATDLKLFGDASISFVYTVITLQHIPGHLQKKYIREFFRVLKPGGVAVFRTLTATTPWRIIPARLVDFYRIIKNRGRPFMGAYGLPIAAVHALIRDAGCALVELKVLPCCESRFGWLATQYCVVKPR